MTFCASRFQFAEHFNIIIVIPFSLVNFFIIIKFSCLAYTSLNIYAAKALELFLQDLCDRTYEITLQRGAKTMSSLHL